MSSSPWLPCKLIPGIQDLRGSKTVYPFYQTKNFLSPAREFSTLRQFHKRTQHDPQDAFERPVATPTRAEGVDWPVVGGGVGGWRGCRGKGVHEGRGLLPLFWKNYIKSTFATICMLKLTGFFMG